MVRALKWSLIIVGLQILSGCSSLDTDHSFHYQARFDDFPLVWPATDTPRYRFVGDLVGEGNFTSAYKEQSPTAKFWQWFIGEEDKPLISLQRPQGIAVDDTGRLYVADVSAAAIYMFDRTSNKMSLWNNGDGRAFKSPIGVTIRDEQLVVTDSEDMSIWVLNRFNGNLLGKYSFPEIVQPVGIVWAEDRQLFFVADSKSSKIHILDDQFNYISSIGDKGTGPGKFNRPTFLAYRSHQLLISDTLNARIQLIDLNSDKVTTIGRRGDYVGNFTRPKGVAFDRDGNLYAIESYFDHLLVFNHDGDFLMPLGGSGSEPGNFFLPTGIAIGDNFVYISDMLNSRISVFQYLGGG